MSFSTIKITGAKHDLEVTIPSTDDLVSGASAGPTVEADLTGIIGSSTVNKLHWIEVDCRDNPIENGTFRLYEATSNPIIGEAHAHVFVPGIRGQIIPYNFPNAIPWTSSKGIYAVYVKGLGGTGGSAAPSGIVRVRLGLTIGTGA